MEQSDFQEVISSPTAAFDEGLRFFAGKGMVNTTLKRIVQNLDDRGIDYAVIGAVYGEYVGAFDGLGIWMRTSANLFRTDLVFGAVAIVVVISVALFLLIVALEAVTIPWHTAARTVA